MPATDEDMETLISSYWEVTRTFSNETVASHTPETMRELFDEAGPMIREMLGPDALKQAEYERRTPIPAWAELTPPEQRAFASLCMMQLFPAMLSACKGIRDQHLRKAN